jgi:serine/threonine-protein kinase
MESQKFGRYVIKGELGRGGMATVYHAYDPRFEREVALKVLPHEMLHDPQFRTRFEREAKTIAMLEHPAIVPVYDFGEEDGQPYFVMRFMTGGSLSDRMKKGPMSVQQVASLYDHLAPALDEAHAKGIIHRDLKPGNILFDQYGEPYISDFGIAKITSGETNVTGSAIVGTPAYMSPEQAQGEGIDGRSDIYGLGVILFELLTGQQPYYGDTPMSVVVKHITDRVPNILDIKPDLPPAIEAIIEKAMAKNRDERFPTVRALADALQSVARGEIPDLESASKTMVASPKTVIAKSVVQDGKTLLAKGGPPAGPSAPRRKTGLWIGLGGVLLLICLAAVGVVIILGRKKPAQTSLTQTVPVVQVTETMQLLPAAGTPSFMASSTAGGSSSGTAAPSPSSTLSPAVPGPSSIGGADRIAFLNNNDIWVMGVDGSNLNQVTKDGADKSDLQWSPDGQSLVYISGKCIDTVSIPGGVTNQITCFTAAEYLEAFEISPDGSQVAISLNRVVYIVPFDLNAIGKARTWLELRDMKGCFTYGTSVGVSNEAPVKAVQWSNDGKKITMNTMSLESGHYVDILRTFDISRCDSVNPVLVDYIPSSRNVIPSYFSHPSISSFDWDGDTLFVLNNKFRYDFGYLFGYNSETKHGETLDPMGTSCCYMESRFSPDGSYLLFIYQDINSASSTQPQLYYIPYGSLGTGASYTPFNLPQGFFNNMSDHLDAALRPVK